MERDPSHNPDSATVDHLWGSTKPIKWIPFQHTICIIRWWPQTTIYTYLCLVKGGEVIWWVPEGVLSNADQWGISLLPKIRPSTLLQLLGQCTDGSIFFIQHNPDNKEAYKIMFKVKYRQPQGYYWFVYIFFAIIYYMWFISLPVKSCYCNTRGICQSTIHALTCHF